MADRVAVIGTGAMAGVLAAALAATEAEIWICARTPVDALHVTSPDGVTVDVNAPVITDSSAVGPVDVVWVTTKTQDTPGAAVWLAHLCRSDTLTVAAQNGLDRAEALRPLIPAGEVVSALLYIAAERIGPGRIAHYAGNRVVVPAGPTGVRIADLLGSSHLEARMIHDFRTAAWRKLLGNVVANPLTVLTMRRTDVLREPAVAELARGLVREAVAVGRAEGAALDDEDVERVVGATGRYGGRTGSSMLYDRLAGRPLEWDAITGEIVRRAARHAIDVPLNAAILALLQALDHAG